MLRRPLDQAIPGPIRVHNPQELLHDNVSNIFDVVEGRLHAWADRHETLAVEGIRPDKVKTKTGLHLDRFRCSSRVGRESVQPSGLPVRVGVLPDRKSASRLLGYIGYRSDAR